MYGRSRKVSASGAVAAVLAVLLAGCGGGRDGAALGQSNTPPQAATLGGFTSPAAALARMPQAAGDPVYARFGREYGAGLTQRTQAQGDCLRFNPAEDDGGAYAGLAFAIYGFNLTDYAGAAEFRLEWVDAPQEEQLWLGLSDWEHGVWRWFHVPAGDVLALPDPPGLAQFTKSGTGELLAAVVMTGQDPALLRRCGVRLDTIVDAWPQYQHDAQHTGRSKHIGPSSFNLKWQFTDPRAPGQDQLNLTIDPQGQVYAAGSRYLYSFNPDGSLQWKTPGNYARHDPLVAPDGTIYISNDIDLYEPQDKIHAFNPDGTVKWTHDFESNGQMALASDGTLYYCHTALYALNPDGSLKWDTSASFPDQNFGPPVCGPDGDIYVYGYTAMYAFSPAGELRWTYEYPDGPDGHYPSPVPVVGTDGNIYADGGSSALRPDGTLIWRTMPKSIYLRKPVIGLDNTLYMACRDYPAQDIYSIVAKGCDTGELKWTIEAEGVVLAGPVIGQDGIVVYGAGPENGVVPLEDYTVYALTSDGSPLWQTELTGTIVPGMVSGANGNIYCMTCFRPLYGTEEYRLYCLNGQGQILWESGANDFYVADSVAVDAEGNVFVAYCNSNVYSLTPQGEQRWKCRLDSQDIGGTPALADDGTLYVPGVNYALYAISPDGTLKWKASGPMGFGSSPVVGLDGSVYIGHVGINSGQSGISRWIDGVLYAFNPDGSTKWTHPFDGGFYGTPAITENNEIYATTSHGDFHALDASGNMLWEIPDQSPWLAGGLAIAPNGSFYGQGGGRELFGVNPDGTEKWCVSGTLGQFEAPALSLDGTIYTGDTNNILYAVNPDGSIAWTFTAAGPIDYSPVVDGAGRIYFTCAGSTYALNPDGTLLWSFAAYVMSPLSIGEDGTIYAGGAHNALYAIGPGMN